MAVQIPKSVRAFLDKPNLAVLATRSRSGRVQATPVWFLPADGHILINTKAGRMKLRNMEASPQVTLVIVDRESGAKDIDRLSQRYGGGPYKYPADDAPKKRISIHIAPEKIDTMGL